MSDRVFNKQAFEPIGYSSNKWAFRIKRYWQKNLLYQFKISKLMILIGADKHLSFGIECGRRNIQINSALLYINISW